MMQETVAGVKIEGDWDDVANSGEDMQDALDGAAPEEDVEAFEEWRPRPDEDAEAVRERTVKHARVTENRVEADGKTAMDEANRAAQEFEAAAQNVADGAVDEASRDGRTAIVRFARSVETAARKVMRRIETVIYTHFQSRTNPYYLDTASVSATLRQKGFRDSSRYELAVDVTDTDASDTFKERMQERR